jgi:hypothetical protein
MRWVLWIFVTTFILGGSPALVHAQNDFDLMRSRLASRQCPPPEELKEYSGNKVTYEQLCGPPGQYAININCQMEVERKNKLIR